MFIDYYCFTFCEGNYLFPNEKAVSIHKITHRVQYSKLMIWMCPCARMFVHVCVCVPWMKNVELKRFLRMQISASTFWNSVTIFSVLVSQVCSCSIRIRRNLLAAACTIRNETAPKNYFINGTLKWNYQWISKMIRCSFLGLRYATNYEQRTYLLFF